MFARAVYRYRHRRGTATRERRGTPRRGTRYPRRCAYDWQIRELICNKSSACAADCTNFLYLWPLKMQRASGHVKRDEKRERAATTRRQEGCQLFLCIDMNINNRVARPPRGQGLPSRSICLAVLPAALASYIGYILSSSRFVRWL